MAVDPRASSDWIWSAETPMRKRGGFLSKYSVIQRSEIKWAYLFIAPQMIGLVIFTLGPILVRGLLELHQVESDQTAAVGWHVQNYVDQLQDPTFGNLVAEYDFYHSRLHSVGDDCLAGDGAGA